MERHNQRLVTEHFTRNSKQPKVTTNYPLPKCYLIHKIKFDGRYSERADSVSELMRDNIMTPLDRAVYWTEFNLRHKGAKHLRLGSRYLSSYQRAMIDVYGVITAAILLPIVFFVFIVLKCYNCCCRKTKKSTDSKKKQ